MSANTDHASNNSLRSMIIASSSINSVNSSVTSSTVIVPVTTTFVPSTNISQPNGNTGNLTIAQLLDMIAHCNRS